MSEFPPPAPLPKACLCDEDRPDATELLRIVHNWLTILQGRLDKEGTPDISDLFLEESWWRDIIALSWDLHTKSGPSAISAYLSKSTAGLGELKVTRTGGLVPTVEQDSGLHFIQSGFTFTTKFGRGTGLVRLVNPTPSEWKAWTVLTQLEALHGHEKTTLLPELGVTNGLPRTNGATNGVTNGATNGVTNGVTNGATNGNGNGHDPQVVIVGAGQSGLGLAAHLKHLGVKSLIVEKGSQAGNAWCERYDSVKTHTTKSADHLPFLKYPSNWPTSQNKEHITRWMGNYATIMGIELQLNTAAEKADYDAKTRRWTLHVRDKDGSREIHTKHLVMALGMVGTGPASPDFPGVDSFKGLAYHAGKHKSASSIPELHNKNVAIIGCATTAHDMAQDFVNHGAKSVTMIQRQPTWSFSAEAIETFHLGNFATPGISTEEADLVMTSQPTAVARVFGNSMTHQMLDHDKEMLNGLEKAGLAVKRGEDGSSFIDSLFFKGGHFYVDQGATPMILDGRIKVHMCREGVKEYSPEGLVLGDGCRIDADVVVSATGFEPAAAQVKKIMGDKIGDKASKFGAFDDELERVGWWRPTGVPGFWYTCGTLQWSRQFAPVLALQIGAVEQALVEGYWEQ